MRNIQSIYYTLLLFTLISGTALVFYFSWLPTPDLGEYGILPVWLSKWTDDHRNGNIRTAIPFTLIGLFCGIWLILTKKGWRGLLLLWVLLITVVGIAETGQLFLPQRHFDWGDVFWGATGGLSGLLLPAIVRQMLPKDAARNN